MRYPRILPAGGKTGFLAPSFGCNTEPYRSAFDAALKFFERKGHTIALGPNVYEGCGTGISNTPEKCGAEVNMMFSGDADALISVGGGELMCEILPYVDFEAIKENDPKWFMGYSDNTNLTFLLNTLCDTASVYGPCASSFGQSCLHRSLTDAYDLLTGRNYDNRGYEKWERESKKDEEHPFETYNLTENRVLEGFIGGREKAELEMKGRLTGGCLDCLRNLCGTRFDKVSRFNERYAGDGIIWFLESCDLGVMDVRRALWQVGSAGWFDRAAGFIIGRPLRADDSFLGLDMRTAFISALSAYDVPVIFGADIGHLPPMMPIISGAKATVTLSGQSFLLRHILE